MLIPASPYVSEIVIEDYNSEEGIAECRKASIRNDKKINLLSHNQHRNLYVVTHGFYGSAEYNIFQHAVPVRTHHQQVGIVFIHDWRDRFFGTSESKFE